MNVKETLEMLSRANLDFMEFVGKNPECLKRTNFRELEELRNKLQLLQPWPTFLNRERKEMFRDAAIKLCNLIKGIPARLFHNDAGKMSAYYELPVNVINLQMEGVTEEHLDNLLARGDFIFSPVGLKCLEYNIAGNLGGHLLPFWESLYLKNPIILKFLKEYDIKLRNGNLLAQYLEHCIRAAEPLASRSGDAEVNISLVLQPDGLKNTPSMAVYLDQLYCEILSKYFSLKGNVFMCDYQELEVKNDCVYYKGRRIHALTEWYGGMVPPRVLNAFSAGNIRIMNGPITNLASSKLNLVLLSENRGSDVFSDEEKDAIKKYVPWTRKILPGETTYGDQPIQLEDFILANKNKLVMKPSLGYGGGGVYIGKNVHAREWEELVKIAFRKKNLLVQELVESGSALYQHGETGCALYDMVWGFFIFGSQYAGTFLRVILKKDGPRIVNTHQGAQISVVFEVDE